METMETKGNVLTWTHPIPIVVNFGINILAIDYNLFLIVVPISSYFL